MIELSVIIPTYNRFSILCETLKSLETQMLSFKSFEVIVINDGSSEKEYQHFNQLHLLFPSLQLHLINSINLGAGQARNKGILAAQGSWVLFLGDDMLVHPYLLKSHLHSSKNFPNCAILGFTDWAPTIPLNSVMRLVAPYGPQFDYSIQNPLDCGFYRFYGSNLSLAKHWLLQDQFSIAFTGCGYEDSDLGYRLEKKGLRIVYNPLAITYHHHFHNERSFVKRQYGAGYQWHTFLNLHPNLKDENSDLNHLRARKKLCQKKRCLAFIQRHEPLYLRWTFERAFINGYLDAQNA